MGKSLIINGADFSGVAANEKQKVYLLGVTDALFEEATSINANSFGHCLANQSALQGHTLYGMKLKVSRVGVIKIYKTTTPNASSMSELTLVAEVRVEHSGMNEVAFSSPVTLAAGEYICIGSGDSSDGTTANWYYGSKTPYAFPFYYNVGKSSAAGPMLSLNIDFYAYEYVLG